MSWHFAHPSADGPQIMFQTLSLANAHRCLLLNDEASGLRAVIALDSVDLGPAIGGVRTRAYATDGDGVADAVKLARAMTLKCAIAGLPAGGAKTVVLDHPGLDRPRAFRRLGEYVQDLKGLYRCGGDLGTTQTDLLAMAETTQYVNTQEAMLSEAGGRGVANCIQACAAVHGHENLKGLRIAIQGCGAMGSGAARELAKAGAEVFIADLDKAKAEQLAREIGGGTLDADKVLEADVDIVAPCAVGGVITDEVAGRMRAWGVCGAANNQLASASAGLILTERGILFVPDFLASAGAVIAGMVPELMEDPDPNPFLERLKVTTRDVLETARTEGVASSEIGERIARARIAEGGRSRKPLS
jgi:leucine dehydrogenase